MRIAIVLLIVLMCVVMFGAVMCALTGDWLKAIGGATFFCAALLALTGRRPCVP